MRVTDDKLICLMEECAEISEQCSRITVRVSKALRFGLQEIQPGQLEDNVSRIVAELTDLKGIIEMLEADGVITACGVLAKKTQWARFRAYAREAIDKARGSVS